MALEKQLLEEYKMMRPPGKVFQATLGMTPGDHCKEQCTLAKLVERLGVFQVMENPDIL